MLAIGSLQSLPVTGEIGVDPEDTEVPFGALVSGATVGSNATNASASLDAATLLSTTNMLYLNNTNATGAWYAKIVLASSSGVANLITMRIGINNGTATDQIVALTGSLTQTQGTYVRLAPGSTNTIYLTQLVTNPLLTSSISFDVYVSDTATGENFVVTKGAFTLL